MHFSKQTKYRKLKYFSYCWRLLNDFYLICIKLTYLLVCIFIKKNTSKLLKCHMETWDLNCCVERPFQIWKFKISPSPNTNAHKPGENFVCFRCFSPSLWHKSIVLCVLILFCFPIVNLYKSYLTIFLAFYTALFFLVHQFSWQEKKKMKES